MKKGCGQRTFYFICGTIINGNLLLCDNCKMGKNQVPRGTTQKVFREKPMDESKSNKQPMKFKKNKK